MNIGLTSRTVIAVASFLTLVPGVFWYARSEAESVASDDQHMRIEAAMHDYRSMRALAEKGIPVHVSFVDGTSKDIVLRERSDALSSEESVEFYSLPSLQEILAHYGVAGFASLGSPAEKRAIYLPRYDRIAIEKYLTQYFDDELHPSTPARFFVANGHAHVSDDAPGQGLALESFYNSLENDLSVLSHEAIELHGVSVYSDVRSSDLEKFEGFADHLLKGGGMVIDFSGKRWRVTPEELVGMLEMTLDRAFRVDDASLSDFVSKRASSLVNDPVIEPQFKIDGANLVVAKEGRAGQGFDMAGLSKSIESWLRDESGRYAKSETSLRGEFSLKIETMPPELSLAKIKSMGIVSKIGTARTSFKGSSKDRIHNITLGASRVTGGIVRPGEEYSLVRGIGYAEKENGYTEEYVIKGDRSKKEAGGGLCQVATTFFRSLLSAGLPVTERHNHRYVVGYYGPGLDATIYDVSVDLKFKNDTGSPILIQAYTEGNELVVEFYGKADGRVAVTSEPNITDRIPAPPSRYLLTAELPIGQQKCVEHAREGMHTYARTVVKFPDGTSRVQDWLSDYTPWAQVCLVGAPWGTEKLPK